MLIKEIHLKSKAQRRGLSEKLAKQKLKKQGFRVYRGIGFFGPGAIHVDYPYVVNMYKELDKYLNERFGYALFAMRLVLGTTKGMPDFLCISGSEISFVEVKLEHESIKPTQIKMMDALEEFGFKVMVF